ncbi:2-oxoacid dehydrogenases acyltransferase-domain-containing protein [Aspergillus keveii]|uniref:Dihydrolipoamide acetyltransferase component of pyruvate dehydrogenase complex n=1 Tax=Aspergillus keveii TaxID=714993 RepID=A0ABR4FN36_9EURO
MRAVVARQYRACSRGLSWSAARHGPFSAQRRGDADRKLFHSSAVRPRIQPYLLADIGEGITECRVVQWFVKPGDRVEQFEPICEVQSDKASVEITSRYDGVITAIHHEADEMATVGKPLLDIDVEDEPSDGDTVPTQASPAEEIQPPNKGPDPEPAITSSASRAEASSKPPERPSSGLAAPAVRRMMKEHSIDIGKVAGTGKNGRVLKEDMLRYISERDTPQPTAPTPTTDGADEVVRLSPTDSQMFKIMTRALSIPHFGYAHNVDLTSLNNLRRKVNAHLGTSPQNESKPVTKLSPLPFILKALSQTFLRYPRLNAHLDVETDPNAPRLTHKHSHDFGIAVDTPNGLLVPVVKGVQNHSIMSLAVEIKRLSELAKAGKLAPSDMKGATFTVSNIGSIGGAVVNPVIVPPMVAIVGVGKVEEVPVFVQNEQGGTEIVKRERVVLSWSADHRVLDGASVARCAESLARSLESIDELGLWLK